MQTILELCCPTDAHHHNSNSVFWRPSWVWFNGSGNLLFFLFNYFCTFYIFYWFIFHCILFVLFVSNRYFIFTRRILCLVRWRMQCSVLWTISPSSLVSMLLSKGIITHRRKRIEQKRKRERRRIKSSRHFCRLEVFLDSAPQESDQSLLKTKVSEDIDFDDVTLHTPNYKRTLWKNMSFVLPKEEALLVVGRSGCGKSSMFRAIARYTLPLSPLSPLSPSVLSSLYFYSFLLIDCGTVVQEPSLHQRRMTSSSSPSTPTLPWAPWGI